MRKKTSTTFLQATVDQIENFPSRHHGMTNFSTRAEEIILDYFAMIDRTKKELKLMFSEDELNYIYDMLNSTLIQADQCSVRTVLAAEVEEADKYDGLGEKWGVNAQELAAKISGMAEFQAYTLAKMADEYWSQKEA